MSRTASDSSIYRLAVNQYIHVIDQTLNVKKILQGPLTFLKQDNEKVILGPEEKIVIPPQHYCRVRNPVVRVDGTVQMDKHGQAKLRHGVDEIRLNDVPFDEPFALYPGEKLIEDVTKQPVVPRNTALLIRAEVDYDSNGKEHRAGDEWLFEGPGIYTPRVEEATVAKVKSVLIRENQSLRVRARRECQGRDGKPRVSGEEWLVKTIGEYLPGAYEEVVRLVDTVVLTDKQALHLAAERDYTDVYGVKRVTGQQWMVKSSPTCSSHMPDVYEKNEGIVKLTTLTSRQYCVILDPVDEEGNNQMGRRKLVTGETTFFLKPNERLENGIQDVYILSENEGLILSASEEFDDTLAKLRRQPGDRWMIRGPTEYVPPVQCTVVCKRTAIPLDENEGVYVRNTRTGKITAVIGKTYMLSSDEELYEKPVSAEVEELLRVDKDPLADRGQRGDYGKGDSKRDRTRVVTFRVPHNAAVQIYDFKSKSARIVFGPELVMLAPDEEFTRLSLSGSTPKKPNVIKALCLLMGPDFMTDRVRVETSDHAQLELKLSYNWRFELTDEERADQTKAAKLFSVPDFVGDTCKAIASRVRGAIASKQFADFHRNSAQIIHNSVMGYDGDKTLRFESNGLVISSVDIQEVQPVDQRTRDALQKSVQLAIEITTTQQEAEARHKADQEDAHNRWRLDSERLTAEQKAEVQRRELLLLQAESAAVESTGQAKAEAQSRAEAARIEGEAAVEQARQRSDAQTIEAESELKRLMSARDAELSFVERSNELEITKAKKLADIETGRFGEMVTSIGADTIKSIAVSGPETQLKMLKALGLSSTFITDGKTPINLFNTASGLVGGAMTSGVLPNSSA